MLIQFSVENYLSIKDKVVLSLCPVGTMSIQSISSQMETKTI